MVSSKSFSLLARPYLSRAGARPTLFPRLPPPPTQRAFISSQSDSSSPPASPDPATPQPYKCSLIKRYTPALSNLSERTGVPLTSLGVSFLVLHEITAALPLAAIYFLFASFGFGAGLVSWVSEVGHEEAAGEEGGLDFKGVVKGWYDEGYKRVDRVGKKYGILGYKKVVNEDGEGSAEDRTELVKQEGSKAAERVADAIAAYVVVKATLPLRIGFSIAAAPAFARYTLVPLRRLFSRGRA
ncbi:hypothetical protein IAT38_006087 [Cryptococcus sp. DSM 104549]